MARWKAFGELVARAARESGAHLVHDRGLWLPENAAAQSKAHRLGLPLIVQPCGMLQDWSMAQSAVKKHLAWQLYQRRLLASARSIVVTSEDERRETARRLPPGPTVAVIPHGVDGPETLPTQPRRRRAVFLGRLHPKKQVDLLLRAWAQIRPAGWELQIAGGDEGGHLQELQTLVKAQNLEAVVHFLGPVRGEAKTALLTGSQLFLQPSLQENFGLAIAEALAHGLPVITTRATPWQEIEQERCGWWVGTDEQSVRTALAAALALPATTLAEMGLRARNLAERYSWRACAKQTLVLYERLDVVQRVS